MSAQVDAVKGEVTVGGRSWRFHLDCRQGTVAVDVGGARVRLRPHSWREKRILARFAHLGEEFLKEQLLRQCLDEPAALPDDGPPREALRALALWLNAPGGEPGLPLDERVLAAVTLQVCHAIQSPPGALDGLDAADVELLWRAARGDPAHPAADQPEGTRIVIVRDRPAAPPEELVGAGLGDTVNKPAPAAAVSVARPAAPAAAETTRPPGAEPAPPAIESRGGDARRPPAPSGSPSPRRGRFRVVVDSPPPPAPLPADAGGGLRSAPTPVAMPTTLPPIDCRDPFEVRLVSRESGMTVPSEPPESRRVTWPWPVTCVSSALAAVPAPAAVDAAPGGGARPPVLLAPPSTAEPAARGAVPLEPMARVLGLADDLVEELGVRLEQAASELGIDLEG